ncbi:MAG: hypothetical protein RLY95_1635, partial [Pseudomonadota bacterium]
MTQAIETHGQPADSDKQETREWIDALRA